MNKVTVLNSDEKMTLFCLNLLIDEILDIGLTKDNVETLEYLQSKLIFSKKTLNFLYTKFSYFLHLQKL